MFPATAVSVAATARAPGTAGTVVADGKVKKLRNRASVVCKHCKMKKIKCDRQKPCANCTKSNLECIYDYSVPKLGISAIVALKQQHMREMAALSAVDHPTTSASITPESDSALISNGFNSENLSVDIFNRPFKLPGDYQILRKPSRTIVRSKFFNAMLNRSESFSRHMLQSFFHLMNNERKSWKQSNFPNCFQLNLLQMSNYNNIDEVKDNITKLLETSICNNYQAILERLDYFQATLNKILFNSFIPMSAIHLIFHHYFVMQPEGVVFRGVSKNYEYNFIAVITSLVELTEIFARFKKEKFRFPLLSKKNEFNEITITLMNTSNFRRKTSIFSIFTLLNLRLSLMVYGDVQSAGMSGQNSYPYFQHALALCMELGVHLDQDSVIYFEKPYDSEKNNFAEELMFCREVPKDSIKLLWNYMLFLDSHYYIQLAIPPAIDERYCHGVYDVSQTVTDLLQPYVTIVKDVSLFFAQTKPITIRELFFLTERLKKLISQFPSFGDITELEKNKNTWCIPKLKFELLKLLMSLLTYLGLFFSEPFLQENFSPDVLANSYNAAYIKKMREETFFKINFVYFIAIETILKISTLSDKFIFYNRDIFSDWFGLRSMNVIDISVAQDKKHGKNGNFNVNENSDPLNPLEFPQAQFDVNRLENALFNYNEIQYAHEISSVSVASKPAPLAAYLTQAYEKVLSIPILHTDYSFFIMAKLFLISIYSLYCYVHIDSKLSIAGTCDKLRVITKRIIEKNQRTGVLTHALSSDQIKSQINKHRENEPHSIPSNATEDSFPATPIADNTLFQMDDLFDSESLKNIFNDMNVFMSNLETV